MEALSQLLSRARNGNFISGFRVGGRGSEGLFVSHLLFADDTLIFCDADADQLQYLSWTFMWFEAISGLKGAYLHPNWVFPLEPPTNPLGCGMQWKKDSGKATFNKALLGKWLWRFANENEPLWKQIILSKYDLQEGGWCSKDARNQYGVGVGRPSEKVGEFSFSFRFIIGDGTRVKFWKDLWCGNQSLEEAFPILFNLSINKEGWVAEAWEEDEGGGSGGFVLIDTLMIGRWEKSKAY
ncbi:hypothetical protein CK203_103828 [Vitis vinifera]|uniref:Uncharacterized protein n=1 Tax=Vitis vinifera TaxID=29760 RepID=A0A438CHP4_VITVI|nr:hypothetical protein CK203_103828 [Vitis vinifera]